MVGRSRRPVVGDRRHVCRYGRNAGGCAAECNCCYEEALSPVESGKRASGGVFRSWSPKEVGAMAMRRSMVVALDWALVELRRLLQSARRGPDALAPDVRSEVRELSERLGKLLERLDPNSVARVDR